MKLYSHVLDAMETQGGSFARALATAYRYADSENAETLEEGFGKLFQSYEEK